MRFELKIAVFSVILVWMALKAMMILFPDAFACLSTRSLKRLLMRGGTSLALDLPACDSLEFVRTICFGAEENLSRLGCL
jgi:hypothetical protein